MVVVVSVAIVVAYIWSVVKLARMSRAPRIDRAQAADAPHACRSVGGVPIGRQATSLAALTTHQHHPWVVSFRRRSAWWTSSLSAWRSSSSRCPSGWSLSAIDC